MTQLLDIFGFVSVLLRGGTLALQSLVLGGAIFAFWVLRPLATSYDLRGGEMAESCRRLIFWSAAALALTELCYVAADAAILAGTAGLSLSELVGANFFIAGAIGAGAAMVIAARTARRAGIPARALLLPSAVIQGALVMTSHAAGRMEQRPTLVVLTALHQVATASWIGGMPYLLLSLSRLSDIRAAQTVCRRFSSMAAISVAVLVAAGCAMSMVYVGSSDAVYGTSYGVMVASKVILLGMLLILGGVNYFIIRRLPANADTSLLRLRRFAEAEAGIGLTLMLAAASLTSQPPAVDLRIGRVRATEIVERMKPRWPVLETPDPTLLSPASPLWNDTANKAPGLQSFVPGTSFHENTAGDIAWSEYNHHWAGLIVFTVGVLAVLARWSRARWARNWPLAFLGLAVFLFMRADPENWPLGPRSFWQSFAVADVLQHRLFVLLIVAFAGFEWSVQTGRISGQRAALVFPAVCAAGGALLLTHSHSLGNIKEELLTELSHVPLAILGVTAGWTRWLELRLPRDGRPRILAWIWPCCFVLIGAVLLNYREN